jgi:hypothetical protein
VLECSAPIARDDIEASDFAMTADETQPDLALMRAAGWDVG